MRPPWKCLLLGHKPIRVVTGFKVDDVLADGTVVGAITESRYHCARCGVRFPQVDEVTS